jgi:hypothetical protein
MEGQFVPMSPKKQILLITTAILLAFMALKVNSVDFQRLHYQGITSRHTLNLVHHSTRELQDVHQNFVPEANSSMNLSDSEEIKNFERNTTMINKFIGQMIKMD